MKELYLVTRYNIDNDSIKESAFNIGIFDSQERAEDIAIEMQSLYEEKYDCIVLVTPLDLNETYVDTQESLEELVSMTLESLMKKGAIDQLIGEDGNFYYRNVKGFSEE